jgi:hypothetical protein
MVQVVRLLVRLVPSHVGTLQEKLSGALAGLHVGHHQTAWMQLKDQFFSEPKLPIHPIDVYIIHYVL